MSDILERAIEHVRALPPQLQETLSEVLLRLIDDGQPVIVMSPQEEALAAASHARSARGEVASDETDVGDPGEA